MDNFYVYIYLRENNSKHGRSGSPYYVGKGHGRRAFSNHGSIPVPREKERIVVVYDGLSEEQAHIEEKRLIMVYGRIDLGTGCLRNRTDGGEGQCGVIITAEWKGKISRALKGVAKPAGAGVRGPRSPERKAQIRQANAARYAKSGGVGRKMTEELRQKISEAKKGTVCSEQTKAKMSASIKANSENIRKAAIGNRRAAGKRSDATRQRISEAGKGRLCSEETRAKRSASLLAVHARKRLQTPN